MFARTKRLTLRPGWPEDAAALTAAIAHEAVVMRLERAPWPYTQADAATWLAAPRAPTDVELLILDHEGERPRLVGGIALIPRDGALALGYWLTPSAWGRGYATEAGRAVIDIARHALGARRLTARYHAANPQSGNVLRKLGFTTVGPVAAVPSLAQGCAVETISVEMDLDQDRSPLPIAA